MSWRIIGRLGFCGYFLIVWDIVHLCREQGILVQGRGSAANSAVCYCLGITTCDPIGGKLLFERFLSEGRDTLAGHRSRPAERRPARARDPGSLSPLRPARRGDDGECHHLSRPQRHARDGQGARPAARCARRFSRPLRQRRFPAHARAATTRSGSAGLPAAHPRLPALVAPLPRRSTACRAISASTPAA